MSVQHIYIHLCTVYVCVCVRLPVLDNTEDASERACYDCVNHRQKNLPPFTHPAGGLRQFTNVIQHPQRRLLK